MATPSEAQRIYSGTIDSHGGAVFQGDLNAARDINISKRLTQSIKSVIADTGYSPMQIISQPFDPLPDPFTGPL